MSSRTAATPAAVGEKLFHRYGEGAIPPAGPWSDAIDLLLSHRSVRSYADTPLPDGTLETLVAAAQSAATSSNLQVWSVVSVTDPARKSRLAVLARNQKHIETCPLYLVWIADLSRLGRVAEQEGKVMEGIDYLEAFMVALIDAALAAQNAVIAAESLGMSTVYIGAMRNNPEAVAAELGLPKRAMAAFGLCVGYASERSRAKVKPRLPQPIVLHREQYGTAEEQSLRASYDATLADFANKNGMPPDDWTQKVLARLGPLEAMHGRHRMREALKALGIELR